MKRKIRLLSWVFNGKNILAYFRMNEYNREEVWWYVNESIKSRRTK
jgi:hypothetical protein